MADMVLLKCDVGSKAVVALCPNCGRISRQILSDPYSSRRKKAKLIDSRKCPVCGVEYRYCSADQAGNWSDAFERYNCDKDSYNLSVKEAYAHMSTDRPNSAAQSSASAQSVGTEPIQAASWWCCGVALDQMNGTHLYISDFGRIDIGTNVLVPFGTKNTPRIGVVTSCQLLSRQEITFPIEKAKHIIRIAAAADYLSQKTDPTLFDTVSSDYAPLIPTLPQATDKTALVNTKAGESPNTCPDENLERKIERWKRELLDTGKRNKMINYRETKRATLRILEPEAVDLFNKLALSEKTLTFQKPINKDTDLQTYSMIALMETLSYTLNVQVGDIKTAGTIIEREKTLKNLRSKAKLAQEEQGANILYLCFGFIYWREQNKEGSLWLKAPLLLMPVSLGLKSLNAPFTLSRYDDEIEVNPTLEYLFSTEYNITLPEFELKGKDSFSEYLARIEEIVDKRGWKLTQEVSLGLLSFLKISMYHDLNNNRERMMKHPVLKAMAGDRSALVDIPTIAEHFDFDAVKPDEWHEVVDADSSQEEAVLLSKLGVSFVMQGPPGTGKSQTITNIIAEALADGKKVLFVSEKAAALEVVLKRLTEVHLDDFCLSLHNHKANKKDIVDSIGTNLSLEPEYFDSSGLNELAELFHDRVFLTKYADALHRMIEPLGESVYMVFGRLSKLEKASAVSFRIDTPEAVTREQYSSMLYVLDAFEKALRNLGGPLDANVWHGTSAKSSGQSFKQQLIQETDGLLSKLKRLDAKVNAVNDEYRTTIGHSWESIKASIADIETALDLPIFPYWWSDSAKRDALLSSVRREAEVHRTLAVSMQSFRGVYRESILDAPLDDWMKRASEILDTYMSVEYGSETSGENHLTEAYQNAEKVEWLLSDLGAYIAQYKAVAESLGLSETDSFQEAKRAIEVLGYLKERPAFRENVWFNYAENDAAEALVDTAQEHALRLRQAHCALEAVWSDSIHSLDLTSVHRTLFEENKLLFGNISASECVAEQLSAHLNSAKDIFDKATSLVRAHTRATEILGIDRADTMEGFRSVAALLKLASEVPYLETAWFDVRKNAAVRPLLNEACSHFKTIKALTDAVLQKWEPEALNMEDEALAMLGRFKTEHVGVFHRMKSGYKEDVKRIRLLSKEVGKTVEETEAIAFLQSLKELHDEKRWYAENQELLQELAGTYYRGTSTDWEAVKNGMTIAAEIADSFPYSNIPPDVISAIQRSASSIQSAAEIKELSAILSEEGISECRALLNRASYLEFDETGASFKGYVIPEIQRFQECCRVQQQLISTLQAHHHSSDGITVQEVRELFDNVNQLRIEETWFSENGARFSLLFANRNHGPESDFEGIRNGLLFAKRVLAFFSGSIPERLVSSICAEELDAEVFDYHMLAQKAIDNLSEGVRHFAPFAYREDVSVSEYTLPRVSIWLSATKQLKVLESEIHPYLVSDKLTMEQIISSLPAAIQSRDLRDRIIYQETDLAHQLGDRYQGICTDWTAIENDIVSVSDYLPSQRPAVSQGFLEIVCEGEELRAKARRSLAELKAARDEAAEPYEAFSKYFEESEKIGATDLSGVSVRYEKCINGFDELNKWLDYVEARADCDAKGLASFTAAIAQTNNTVSDVRCAFERGFFLQWLSAVIDDVPAVQSFRRRVHEQRSERFIKLDKKQYEISRKRIRELVIGRFPSTNGMMRAGSELRILTHEMEKRQRIMPLRKLFKSIPNLLLTLKPCLMMSPLSVAYFLDADSYQFDMVIFDEASQIFPQDAIGAIFRAKQVIIAGDTKQLPPTNFFAASTSNSGDGYDDEEEYAEEVYDSILEETANILPNRTLLWHYRSKHEHLIAFSNQEIYRNNLVTFPSSNESEPDTGVEFEYVPEGYYEPSPKNYNILEARRCVQLVKEHIDKHPDRSLGIIAFSEKQQQAIALEIQRFREKNPEYEDFFAEEKEDEFFVKNLENVQGDERDTIFFSIGYARTKEQKASGKPMAMRFGPLGVQGGERRLNVAITRAKINVKLISSILPSDIDLNKTESEGVRLLRSYIEFSMNGEATLSAAHKVSRTDDFVDAIAQFIRDHGFKVRQYVGCSGYKIDIAVQHPSNVIEQFVAGIECDGYSYASAKTTRDRDRLRSTVLKAMGWNLYRVWSSEWHQNPELEGQKLLDFIKKAIAECDVKIKALEEEKRRLEEAKRHEIEKARMAREAEEHRRQQELEEREARRLAELQTAERRRREEAERRAAQQTAARIRENEQKAAAEKARIETQQKQKRGDLSWVRKGVSVFHKNFGIGTIMGLYRDQIRVRFGSTERTFMYPSVFNNGLLTKTAVQENAKTSSKKGPEWVKVGVPVSHKTFGPGVIVKTDDYHTEVKFGDRVKTFVYPDAFNFGFLIRRDAATSPSAPEQK